jgi:hypothetical protein
MDQHSLNVVRHKAWMEEKTKQQLFVISFHYMYNKNLERCPPGRKKQEKNMISKFVDAESFNWNEREGINNVELIDREEWRRKIKL